jgi:hypothetical protein
MIGGALAIHCHRDRQLGEQAGAESRTPLIGGIPLFQDRRWCRCRAS